MNRGSAIALVAALLAGCSAAQSSNSSVTYQTYTYTCCENGETLQVWHPAERRTIKWTAVPAATTSEATATPIVIRTRLVGPFATVAELKNAISSAKPTGAARKVDGIPLRINNRTGDAVVSVIQLPPDLPPGLYNLELDTDYGGARRTSGSAIVVVN